MDAKRINSDNFTMSNRGKSNIGNLNDWKAPYLFRIFVIAIIFSPTVSIKIILFNQYIKFVFRYAYRKTIHPRRLLKSN